jgi:hypothetical protein
MGQSAQQTNQPTQVYYDPEKGQYFSYNQPNSPFGNLFGIMGMRNTNAERNYFGNSLISSADRFTPKNIEPNYPDMNELFPALNANLAQNLQQSLLAPTDTQSSGAARFLAPSNTSKGK